MLPRVFITSGYNGNMYRNFVNHATTSSEFDCITLLIKTS